jgi:flavin-dependent dehydrogenase
MSLERRQVVVIGAGPSGSIASALLKKRERDVLVLERERFPRFSVGESLLVHCLDFVAEAGMLEAVDAATFQYKNGAAFARNGQYTAFDFSDRFTPGRASTYQVQRATFDQLLADEAQRQGVEIRFETEIVAADFAGGRPVVTARNPNGIVYQVEADFVLDGSGFGRTLARLLSLEQPSDFPVRHAYVTHVTDRIPAGAFDRDKVRVTVHPQNHEVWFWLIPLSGGRCSVGVVARPEFLQRYSSVPLDERLREIMNEDPALARLFADAEWDTPVREIGGYAAHVKSMYGPGFALLGNAAEFLDPIFSSGITIAMRSASMAAETLDRQFAGQSVDWGQDFEKPLQRGIDCFRAYVDAWYDGRFQNIVFYDRQPADIRRMICAVLAGYAWDESNPFAVAAERRLDVLAQLCAG